MTVRNLNCSAIAPFALGLALVAGGMTSLGCDDKPDAQRSAERAGDKVQNAAEKFGDKTKDAADKVGDKAEAAGDKIKDASHDAADKARDAAK